MKIIAISLVVAAGLSLLSGPAAAFQNREDASAEDRSAVLRILDAHPGGLCEGSVCSLNKPGTAKLLYQVYNRRLLETRSEALKQRVLAGIERVRGIPWAAEEHQAEAAAMKDRAEELERRVDALEDVLLEKEWADQWRGGEIRYEFKEGVDWRKK